MAPFTTRVVLSHLLASVLAISYVHADTSMYIPGFAGTQPVSIEELGVGSDGRTEWRVVAEPIGTYTGNDGFPVGQTLTMVEGPSDAFVWFSIPSPPVFASYSCAFANNSIAKCYGFAIHPSTSYTVLQEVAISSFLVEGGATSPATPLSTSASRSTSSGLLQVTSSGSSSSTALTSSPGASIASPSSTTSGTRSVNSNGAGKLGSGLTLLLLLVWHL